MSTHRRSIRSKGFSLVELVIVIVIVGLLAAIAIPRFSRGAAGASDSAVAGDLSVLRNAIEMYAAEHNGAYPSDTPATFIAQLTTYSDAAGNTNATKTATYQYGPYLLKVPALKAGDQVGSSAIVAGTAPPADGAETAGNGWVYNATTGQIWANEFDYASK